MLYFSYGCNKYIQNATHLVNNFSFSLLDHFYSNKDTSHISFHILIHDISDHVPIVTITKNIKSLKQFCNKYKRDTKHFVADEFFIDLDQGWTNYGPQRSSLRPTMGLNK